MSKIKYTLEKPKIEPVTRVVTIERAMCGIQIRVNDDLVCAFNDDHNYLDLYCADKKSGLENEGGFLKVVK